ncbi:putative O-methylsterigmatocystin oxidoreductase [Delitschia confertaspora ATCC 74209]|uniref:O-methylsterigmatocystin oxidoreductase n=1 Tax=Delitschia confertaspora ATCC 74209 TaxID=1513339 RepID=A0A9P4MWV6_9PLEO|nr:putative O-methylsterigmatocystin oxidoreductase [Delitschia confertaspora ATCC 74209]
MPSSAVILAVVLLLGYFIRNKIRSSKFPPGPRRLPVIGNLLEAPEGAPWIKFNEWIQQYGPLVSLDFGGTNIILIGTHEVAKDLLDKRGNIYSDRPHSIMVNELTTRDHHILFRHQNSGLFAEQRLQAPVLSPRASQTYKPVQDLETKVLLKALLTSNDFTHEFERLTASVVYTLSYGTRIHSADEWNVRESVRLLEDIVHIGNVGAKSVDAFPLLKYVPEKWSPWKKRANNWHESCEKVFMHDMKLGMNAKGWNWTKDMRAAKEAASWSEVDIAFTLGILNSAGIETTTVTLKIFVLACATYGPSFMPRAQAELDSVVGDSRLPEFSDLEHMPYIEAIVEETFRWRHLAPGGIPHSNIRDDYYNGYLIPKGAVVLPIYDTLRKDTNLFADPTVFLPERWEGKSPQGQSAVTGLNNFGFGRRICPGRHIASNSLRLSIARMLWAFDIRAEGKAPVVQESTFTAGFVSHPRKFGAVFKSRSERRKSVIEKAFSELEFDTPRMMDEIKQEQIRIGIPTRA